MKTKIFPATIIIFLILSLPVYAQLNTGTGSTWGDLSPGEPLLLNEKFQGFAFFHTDPDPNAGNSDNKLDNEGNVIFGYKNDTVTVPIIGSATGKIFYYYYQCAFAPNWKTAYAYRDSLSGTGTPVNTLNVSNGFVEISRTYASNPPTVHGWFIVDLRQIEFVEVIQWSHSSTGGNKRGVLCEFSLDNGKTWDTLRYQPGTNFNASFTKDVTTREKTANGFRCDPSAYGMTWEDGIYAGRIMLRFGEAGGQTPRIHDLKVYGTFSPATTINDIEHNDLEIHAFHKQVVLSETADVAVYNLTGSLIFTGKNMRRFSLEGTPGGIYFVKARSGNKLKTVKVLIQ